MKRENLIAFCKYYKGENECPFKNQNLMMLWMYEQDWVVQSLKLYDDEGDSSLLDSNISEYIASGLAEFENNDGVPISLKSLIFNRFSRDCYSLLDAANYFKDFYHQYYKKGGK